MKVRDEFTIVYPDADKGKTPAGGSSPAQETRSLDLARSGSVRLAAPHPLDTARSVELSASQAQGAKAGKNRASSAHAGRPQTSAPGGSQPAHQRPQPKKSREGVVVRVKKDAVAYRSVMWTKQTRDRDGGQWTNDCLEDRVG